MWSEGSGHHDMRKDPKEVKSKTKQTWVIIELWIDDRDIPLVDKALLHNHYKQWLWLISK